MTALLKRQLGYLDAMAIVFGRIVGSGIFRTPGLIMLLIAGLQIGDTSVQNNQVVYPALFYLAWVIGGGIVFLSALCFSEMVCMYPKSGGSYEFLKHAYSDMWAGLFGWTMFFVSETASIVTVSYISAEYASIVWSYITGEPFSKVTLVIFVIAVIWSFTLLNSFGLQLSGRAQRVISSIKLLLLFSIVVFTFSSEHNNISNVTQNFWPTSEAIDWQVFLHLGLAMQFAFFTYSGWEGATYVAEEVKQPQKNLPISLLLGIGGVIVVYILVNTGYLLVLGPQTMILEQKQVASKAMEVALGRFGGLLLAFFVLFSTSGNVSTQIMVKARLLYAMGRDKYFFRFVNHIHPKFGTPNRALFMQATWASLLFLILVVFSKNFFSTMISYFAFSSAIFNITIMFAVYRLRKKYPNKPRPFRVAALPLVLLPVIAVHTWLLSAVLIQKPLLSMIGFSFVIVGLLFLWTKKTKRF